MSRSLGVALALLVTPCVALAHHSAIRFDLSIRDRMVSGIVKEFEPANPHTKIVLTITDDKGTRDVEFAAATTTIAPAGATAWSRSATRSP